MAIASADVLASRGTLVLTIGGVTQTIRLNSSNDSLSTLAAAINASDFGVTASAITATGEELCLANNPRSCPTASVQERRGCSHFPRYENETLSFTCSYLPTAQNRAMLVY